MRKPRRNERIYVDAFSSRTAADIMSVAHAEALVERLQKNLDDLNNTVTREARDRTDPEQKAAYYKKHAIIQLKARIVELQQA